MNTPVFDPFQTATVAMPLHIAGTGRALPLTRVTSEELDARHGLPAGHLARTTGVSARHVCEAEDQIDLAVSAARAALANAGRSLDEVDLVLSAAAVPYQPLPAMAPLVMQRMGMAGGQAMGYDVNASCMGFLGAVDIAAAKLALGQARVVLVVAADRASRALPWEDAPEVAALFGDGAGAAVLERAAPGGPVLRASLMRTHPEFSAACEIAAGGTRFDFRSEAAVFAQNACFRMDGKRLFRATHTHFPAFVESLLAKAGWTASDIDLVVPHQASPGALAHMTARLGLRPRQIVDVVKEVGNQVAASLPFALDVAAKDGRLARGTRVLMLGTSAGVSFGGLALEV